MQCEVFFSGISRQGEIHIVKEVSGWQGIYVCSLQLTEGVGPGTAAHQLHPLDSRVWPLTVFSHGLQVLGSPLQLLYSVALN